MAVASTPVGFEPWPKIPRLARNIVITEKIDGTNAAVGIRRLEGADPQAYFPDEKVILRHGDRWAMRAQSRKRLITPTDDNFGFAAWAFENIELLTGGLGEGLHFGEWWGEGIGRRYGIEGKRFSLFNTKRWSHLNECDGDEMHLQESAGPLDWDLREIGVRVVPTLSNWTFDTTHIDQTVRDLASGGSHAAPGFMDPEGVIVFHPQSQTMFKVTCKNDEQSKGELERAS